MSRGRRLEALAASELATAEAERVRRHLEQLVLADPLQAVGDLALPLVPAIEEVIQEPGPSRVREELEPTEPDSPPRIDPGGLTK